MAELSLRFRLRESFPSDFVLLFQHSKMRNRLYILQCLKFYKFWIIFVFFRITKLMKEEICLTLCDLTVVKNKDVWKLNHSCECCQGSLGNETLKWKGSRSLCCCQLTIGHLWIWTLIFYCIFITWWLF